MKRNVISIFAFFLLVFATISSALGQENAQPETLFKKGNGWKPGFFVAPQFQLGSIDNSTLALPGVRAGVQLGQGLAIGGSFSRSVGEMRPASEISDQLYMDMQLGGLLLEFTTAPNKLVHFTFPLVIGAGEVEMDTRERFEYLTGMDDNNFGEEHFFFIEPSAQLEINLHKYVRLNLGASYRFVNNASYRGLDHADLSGFNAVFGIKAGMF